MGTLMFGCEGCMLVELLWCLHHWGVGQRKLQGVLAHILEHLVTDLPDTGYIAFLLSVLTMLLPHQ